MNIFRKKITIDKVAGAAYLYLRKIKKGEVENSMPIHSDIILDYDKNGVLIGIEFLSLDLISLDLLDDDFEVVYL